MFHEKEGIKYSYIVHPGGNADNIKIKYSGENYPKLLEGKIEWKTNVGVIKEEAPVTFYQGSENNIASSFSLRGNTLGFNIESFDHSQTIVIDPWIIFPVMPVNNKSLEVQKDPAGNVYVYGGQTPFTLNKYSSAGVLIWTLALPLGVGNWSGDLIVHDNNFSYATNGSGSAGNNIAKINNATGTVVWVAASGTMAEMFRLVHNCDKTKVIAIGGAAGGRWGDINQVTGASVTTFMWGNAEIKSICRAPNGNFYCLTAGAFMNRLYSLNGSLSVNWMIMSTYAIPYHCPVYLTPGSGNGGFNGIAANNKFIYTYDGLTLMKRDICNGNLLGSTNVPSAVVGMDGGIMLDSCGSVYVGSQNGIYKYDPNLSLITSSVTPAAVYDISVGNAPGELLACGDGFAAAINMLLCDPLPFSPTCPVLTATISSAPCSAACVNAATVTPTGTPPFEYLWAPGGQTTQAVSGLCPSTYSVYVVDRYIKLCPPVTTTIICAVLPIELISFISECSDDHNILLHWATASEINNNYFTVERSRDGNNFEVIGTVKGEGNSNARRNYQFIDASPIPFGDGQELSYYRLKQTDYNGRFQYSEIIYAENNCYNYKFDLFPNPNTGNFMIECSSGTHIIIYNLLGELIHDVYAEKNKTEINLEKFSSGVYYVKAINGGQQHNQKVIIE